MSTVLESIPHAIHNERCPNLTHTIRIPFARLLLALLMGLIAASTGSAETITKQELLQMVQAKLPNNTIVATVKTNGLAFALDPAALNELRGAGVSEDLLKALAEAGGPAQGSPGSYDLAKEMLKAGHLESAADAINSLLKANPADLKARTLLVYLLLRQNKLEDAGKEIQTIESSPEGSTYREVVAQLRAMEGTRRALLELRGQVNAKLRAYDGNGAADVIRKSNLASASKSALFFEIALLQGRFDDCRKMLQQNELQGDSATMAQLDKSLRETEERALAIRKQLTHDRRSNFFGVGPKFNGFGGMLDTVSAKKLSDTFPSEEFPELKDCIDKKTNYLVSCAIEAQLKTLIAGVETYAGLTPLSADTENELFLYSLLARPYEETVGLGKQILAANGSLKIPFDHRNGYAFLVIDQKAGVIRTEQGEAFPKYDHLCVCNFGGSFKEFMPFTARIDTIAAVDQKVSYYVMAGKSWPFGPAPTFLSLSDNARVYSISMLYHITYLYGETASRQVVHNFGQFMADVIARPNLKIALEDTEAKKGGGVFSAIVLGAAAGLNPALAPLAIQQVQQQEADRQAAREMDPLGSAAWKQMAIEQPFQAFWKGIEDKLDSVGEAILK